MKCQLSISRVDLNNFSGENYTNKNLIQLMDLWFGQNFYDIDTDAVYWQFEDDQLVLAQIVLKGSYQYMIKRFNLCAEDDEVTQV